MKIKVLHIITDLSVGGAEMMLYKLLLSMDRNNFENIVISLKSKTTIGEKIETNGIPVYYLQMEHLSLIPESLLRIIQLSHASRPDVIMGWMYHANLVAFLIQPFLVIRAAVVWNIRHSLSKLSYEKRILRLLIKLGAFVSKTVSVIVYNSETSRRQHRRIGFACPKQIVIPNGFDLSRYRPSRKVRQGTRKELSLQDHDLLIGHIGRYHPMKDHMRFVESAKAIIARYPNVYFLMVGRGVDEHNQLLIEQIIRLGIVSRFKLLGERQDIHALLPALDIFVSTSAWGEAFPNIIGEAMACGVPCLATDIGDNARILGQTGIIVPPRDTQAIVSGISSLIDMGQEPRCKLGQEARLRIKNEFMISSITRRYEALFKAIG